MKGTGPTTEAELVDFLRPLERFLDDKPPKLPGFDGWRAVAGCRYGVAFTLTFDHDGQVEAALSVSRGCPGKYTSPTEAQGAAFFRALGVEPVSTLRMSRIRHYVVRKGMRH
jgi:hypothetical protein